MLTRLEVDGFKNLIRFEVDFGPFNCLAGPNGIGKSNIFDAIRFLSLLADNTLYEAARKVRGELETADVRDLFWTDGEVQAQKICLAAEMIVPSKVYDDIGREVTPTSTYLRYEVEIGYQVPDFERGNLGRLVLLSEGLHDYTIETAKERLRFPHSEAFFKAVIRNKRATKSTFISTLKAVNGQSEIIISANGSQPQIVPSSKARRTIIGTASMWASPIILAARREMQNWRLLAMEPSAMRRADPIGADPHLTTQGGHLHATLYRVGNTPTSDNLEPEQIYGFIETNLGRLLSIREIDVDLDPMRKLLMTQVKQRFGGGMVPARSLSDGTLRFLALAVLNEDPDYQGLLCLEEPENGIHPGKMELLIELLKEMVVDTSIEPDEYNPFRQLIMATHSPYLVQLLQPNDLLVALQPMVRGSEGKLANTLRCLPLPDTWRLGENGQAVGWTSLLNHLVAPPKPGIKLPASLVKG